jgi:hypothetical protein
LPLTHRGFSRSVAGTSTKLPIHVVRNIGPSAKILFGAGLIAVAYEALPLLFSGASLLDTLVQGGQGFILLGICLLLTILYFAARDIETLDIDTAGVRITSKRKSYFYDWADIEKVSRVKGATRLHVRGFSDEQNFYNFISDRFGVKPEALVPLIDDQIARHSPAATSGAAASGRSITPGHDLAKTKAAVLRKIFTLFGVMVAVIFGGAVVWQVSDYLKADQLHRHGVRTSAHVVRLFTGVCGRRGCDMHVEYAFEPIGAPGKSIHGFAYLAGYGWRDDPDYKFADESRTVPIAYDSTDFSRSDLNFHDSVFTDRPSTVMFTVLLIIGIGLLVVAGLVSGLLYVSMRGQQVKVASPPALVR